MSKTYLQALTGVGKNLQSGINKLKETKANHTSGVYSINDFEEAADDATLLYNAIIAINTAGGGELRLEAREYNITSKIAFNVNIRNVDIVGVTNATVLNFTNTNDYGMVFNNPVLRLKFINVKVNLSATNKGIGFPRTTNFSYHVYFRNCNFYGGIANVTMEHGAYIYFENSTFAVNSGANDEGRIIIGSKTDNACYNEYFYIRNCNIDGKTGEGVGNGINVYQCEYLVVSECDICNWYGKEVDSARVNGYGINLESYGRIWDIYILNCSIPRCNVDVYIYAKTSTIQKIFIENLYDFTPKTSWVADSNVIKTLAETGYNVQWLIIDKLNLLPDAQYVRTTSLSLANINYGYVENIGDNITFTKTSVNYFTIKLMRDELRRKRKKTLNTSNSTLEVSDVSTVVSCNPGSALTLSTISGGENGYEVTFIAKTSYLTISNNSEIVLKNGADKTLSTGDTLTIKCLDAVWYEV